MEKNKYSLQDYWPLACLVLVAALGGWAICYGIGDSVTGGMHYTMGFLFCQFSMLKLFDISGFAEGFQKYDLIAKNNRYYGLAYPWIELGLGLLYLTGIYPILTYLLTLILMTIGTVGVIKSLREGLDTYCACMGSVLKVPLSTVTLAEDIGMGAMALMMLIWRVY